MTDDQTIGSRNDREVILSARGITVGFGDHVVLDNLDLDIYRGEILGFVGASGAGKSVLMRTILRLDPWLPHGKVWLNPVLPPGIGYLRVESIPLAGRRVTVERHSDRRRRELRLLRHLRAVARRLDDQ